jgi:hypothetical protein
MNHFHHTYIFPLPDLPWCFHIALWDLDCEFSLNYIKTFLLLGINKECSLHSTVAITLLELDGAMWGVAASYLRFALNLEWGGGGIARCPHWTSENSGEIANQMQPCNRIYYSTVHWRLNMFRAAHRSSSGVLTVFAATGLHTHVVTGRSQVCVGTQYIYIYICVCVCVCVCVCQNLFFAP